MDQKDSKNKEDRQPSIAATQTQGSGAARPLETDLDKFWRADNQIRRVRHQRYLFRALECWDDDLWMNHIVGAVCARSGMNQAAVPEVPVRFATCRISRRRLLAYLPDLSTITPRPLPTSLSLLSVIGLLVAGDLSSLRRVIEVLWQLLLVHKVDAAETVRLLLDVPDFPRTVVGLQCLETLLPHVRSDYLAILDSLIQAGSPQLFAFYTTLPIKQLLIDQLRDQYHCGSQTIFHRLCSVQSFAEADARVAMMKAVCSTNMPTGFEKFKSPCHGRLDKLCLNPKCPRNMGKWTGVPLPDDRKQREQILDHGVERKEAVRQSASPQLFDVDAINVRDKDRRSPLDYASLWAERKHVDVLTVLGMSACDDLTCLFRFQAGRLARTFGLSARLSPLLFPNRSDKMLQTMGSQLSHGNFGSLIRAQSESDHPEVDQELAVKRLYSTTAPVTNAALRIAALGNLAPLGSVVRVVALDSDTNSHLLLGTQLIDGGSLARCQAAENRSGTNQLATRLQQTNQAGFLFRLNIAVQAASALAKLHGNHCIHGDVHPSHLLLSWDEKTAAVSCHLSGLDLSPSLHDTPSHIRLELWSPWTCERAAFPPELVPSSTSNHVNNYTQLSDVYCLGSVLEWLFACDLKYKERFTADLKYVVERCLQSEPKDRLTASQLHALLSMVQATNGDSDGKDPNHRDAKDPDAALWSVVVLGQDKTKNVTRLTRKNWRTVYDKLVVGCETTIVRGEWKPVPTENKVGPRKPPAPIDQYSVEQCTQWFEQMAAAADAMNDRVLATMLADKARLTANVKIPRQRPFIGIPIRQWPLMSRDNHRSALSATMEQKNRAVILGASGTGKTALAIEYCHVHRREYSAIVWIDAHGSSLLIHSFKRAASALRGVAPTSARSLIEWLEKIPLVNQTKKEVDQTKKEFKRGDTNTADCKSTSDLPALLVLDDAMVRDIDLYRPADFSTIRLLVTSASTTVDWKGWPQVELKALDQEQGPKFFDGVDGKNASVVASVLGYSPLLLTLSSAFSIQCKHTSDSFLAFLQLQMKASNSRDYATSCLDFLIQQVPLLDKTQTASDLLCFASNLAPSGIPAILLGRFLNEFRKSDDAGVHSAVSLVQSLKLLSIDTDDGQFVPDRSLCSMHPIVAQHVIRDQHVRKEAARVCRVSLLILHERLHEKKVTTDELARIRLSLLPHVAAISDQTVAPSQPLYKELVDEAAQFAEDSGDVPLANWFRARRNGSAPVGTSIATLIAEPVVLPNRLKMPDHKCDIWTTAAYWNAHHQAPKPRPIEPVLDKYLRNLWSHYAPLPVRKDQLEVFERWIRQFLQGLFFVSGREKERNSEATRRQGEFEAEFKQSKQHTAFHLTTHAHSHLIRIMAKLANFFTAHFRSHRDFENGILQLLDIADAFGPSGNKLFDAFTKHEFGERDIIFCFRRYDGDLHTNNYRQHPPGSDVHTGLYSFTVRGVLLTRVEMEQAMADDDLKASAQKLLARVPVVELRSPIPPSLMQTNTGFVAEQKREQHQPTTAANSPSSIASQTTDAAQSIGTSQMTQTIETSSSSTPVPQFKQTVPFGSDGHDPAYVANFTAPVANLVSENKQMIEGKDAIASVAAAISSVAVAAAAASTASAAPASSAPSTDEKHGDQPQAKKPKSRVAKTGSKKSTGKKPKRQSMKKRPAKKDDKDEKDNRDKRGDEKKR